MSGIFVDIKTLKDLAAGIGTVATTLAGALLAQSRPTPTDTQASAP